MSSTWAAAIRAAAAGEDVDTGHGFTGGSAT
jgi:hypothetical protein